MIKGSAARHSLFLVKDVNSTLGRGRFFLQYRQEDVHQVGVELCPSVGFELPGCAYIVCYVFLASTKCSIPEVQKIASRFTYLAINGRVGEPVTWTGKY
jgi:hypothetical protein